MACLEEDRYGAHQGLAFVVRIVAELMSGVGGGYF